MSEEQLRSENKKLKEEIKHTISVLFTDYGNLKLIHLRNRLKKVLKE